MDEQRFDAIARALGTPSRRRGMAKAAAGGVLGLVGLSALADSALARRCDKNNDCKGNDVCKNKKCVECKNNKQCSNRDKCKKNKCVRR